MSTRFLSAVERSYRLEKGEGQSLSCWNHRYEHNMFNNKYRQIWEQIYVGVDVLIYIIPSSAHLKSTGSDAHVAGSTSSTQILISKY